MELLSTAGRSKDSKKEVYQIMKYFRRQGRIKHNFKVLTQGSGTLYPAKRPSVVVEPSLYLPCPECCDLYKRTQLSQHVRKTCDDKRSDRPIYRKVQIEAQLMLPTPVHMSRDFKLQLISNLQAGILTGIITHDELIILRGEHLFTKHRHLPQRLQYVRCKLREIARLLLAAKRIDPKVKELTDLISVLKYTVLIEATKITCGFDSTTNTYKIPSLALKLGYELQHYSWLLRRRCVMKEDWNGRKKKKL